MTCGVQMTKFVDFKRLEIICAAMTPEQLELVNSSVPRDDELYMNKKCFNALYVNKYIYWDLMKGFENELYVQYCLHGNGD